ncbi:hypothetical protein HMPREF1986_00776 [Oribacterium sp. oral taxon 078 str. F0263]|nr:hypothetical protein HMPREF1986_00776 [Oribacterium sp. oral taxon 078 str. F0263]
MLRNASLALQTKLLLSRLKPKAANEEAPPSARKRADGGALSFR